MDSNFQETNAFMRPNVEQNYNSSPEVSNFEQPKPVEAEEEKKFEAPIVKDDKSIDEISHNAITDYQQDSIKNIQEQVRNGKDMKEAAKDLSHVIGYSKAMEDNEDNKKFIDKFVEKKQKEMIASANTAVAEEETKLLDAQRRANEQFYKSYRPILEMDLSPFLHDEKKKKKVKEEWIKGKKVVSEEPETEEDEVVEKKPDYSDRGYGIGYMKIMIGLLIIPYMIAALVLSVLNIIKAVFLGINSIFVAFSKFSKPALIICSGIAGITLVGIFVYVVILCFQAMFNIQIIPEVFAETMSGVGV